MVTKVGLEIRQTRQTPAELLASVVPSDPHHKPLNLLRFGAKGDGVTDDTAAINTALSVLQQGDELYCPTGTYKVTSQLIEPTVTYWSMRGDGPGTDFDISGVGAGSALIAIKKRGGGLFKLQISGDVASLPNYTVHGVKLGDGVGVSNISIEQVRITYCDKGMVINNSHDTTSLKSIELFQNTTDVSVEGTVSSSHRFIDCQLLESEKCFDISIDTVNFTWTGCTFAARPYSALTKPINLDYFIHGMLFEGCRFEHAGTNLGATNWDSVYIDGVNTSFPAISVSFIGNYFAGTVVENHINANRYCVGLVAHGNLFKSEPNTSDIKIGASTVLNSLEGGNYYGAASARATQSLITNLAPSSGISGLPTGGTMRLEHTVPWLQLREVDAGVNEKNWDIVAVGGQLRFRAANDADSGWTNFLTIDRIGTNVTAFNVKDPMTVNGTAAIITSGTGTPESIVTAPIGSLYTRTDGGAGTSLYIKESGTGNTGWVAK